jgi:subtilisin family serine protease
MPSAVVVAAAGNTGSQTVLYPAAYAGVIAVAALDAADHKASFSAYGKKVDLSAPGTEIYSSMPGNAYAWWSGTSMATAVVSGTASLVPSLFPAEESPYSGPVPPKKAFNAIYDTAVSVDSVNPDYEKLLGEGRVDILAAALELLSY